MTPDCIDYKEMFPEMVALPSERTPTVQIKDAAINETLGGKPDKRWILQRLIWAMHNGPIPEGFAIGTTCRNRHCVNIAHLKMGRQGSFGNKPDTIDPLETIKAFIATDRYKNAT